MADQNTPDISKRLLCMEIRYWLYLIVFFQYTLIVFLFGCLGTRRWVRKGQDTTEWEGGILRITGSQEHWKGMLYNDVKSEVCDQNNYDELCTVFKNLYRAGAAYIFFELLALIFVLVWIVQVFRTLMEKPLNKWWIAFLWPGLSFLFHLLGLFIWAGITKATFEPNCLGLHSETLCSTNGPALSILTILLYVFFGAIYSFVHIFRNGIVKSQENEEKEDN